MNLLKFEFCDITRISNIIVQETAIILRGNIIA